MTQQTTDRVMEGKTYRQNMMDKLSIEAGEADTCRPEGGKDLYVQKLEKRIESLKGHLDDMTEKSRELETDLRKKFEADRKTLDNRIYDLKTRLDNVRRTSGDAWKEMGDGASRALTELMEGFKSAAAKFK